MVDLDFLASIPIFSFFTRPELEAAQKLFREVTYAKDDVVVRIGEPGDTFFVVLDGELEVWDASVPPRQTGTLRKGDFFGEMALLQGGKRTATVKAARRAPLLAVDKPAFDQLFLKNPKAIEYFARILSKRLAGVTRAERIRRATTTISIASPHGHKGETVVAFSLAVLLKELTKTEVVFVDVQPSGDAPDSRVLDLLSDSLSSAARKYEIPRNSAGPTQLKITVPLDLNETRYGDLLSNLVSRLSDHFSFIVIDLGSHAQALIDSAPAYTDVFVTIVDSAEDDTGIADPRSMKILRVINLFNAGARPRPISSSEPFVLPYSPVFGHPPAEAAEYIRTNPRSAPALPLFRLAHLGVLKVLEEDGVHVDLVAGCSQGSIIAVGYAAGLSVTEMIAIARELGAKRNFLFASDPTFFTKPGILSGQRFLTMMRPYLKGKESFEQLLLPCKTVATDIETGERVAIGSGRLETAFRASSSVPMVMAPLKDGDRCLVDGGVADPVPAEITSEMGADITVAVNVVPRMKRGIETVLSYWYRRMNVFNPLSYLADTQGMPNLFDIVMNSMQILQYELGNFKAITADVLINPDLSDFTWIEYYRADELIERGAEAAQRALPAIHKVIEAKIAPIQQAAPTALRPGDTVNA